MVVGGGGGGGGGGLIGLGLYVTEMFQIQLRRSKHSDAFGARAGLRPFKVTEVTELVHRDVMRGVCSVRESFDSFFHSKHSVSEPYIGYF